MSRPVKPEPPPNSAAALATLQSTLRAALLLTQELANDPVLGRLLVAFSAMPADDRPVVVKAIEREVKARVLSQGAESVTGYAMVPNPRARLYIRAHQTPVAGNLLERDEMLNASLQTMRLAGVIQAVPEIYASWKDATREAIQRVDPDTRAVVERLMRDVLDLLHEAGAVA